LVVEEVLVDLPDASGVVVLDGGIDDPDGVGGDEVRASSRRLDDGWDLDADEDIEDNED